MFIKLTNPDGSPVLVNVAQIKEVSRYDRKANGLPANIPCPTRSRIWYGGFGDSVQSPVRETLEQIEKKIRTATLAEFG